MSAIQEGPLSTLLQLPSYTRDKQIYIPENAVDTQKLYSDRTSDEVTAAFAGRLVPCQGADMAVDAISLMSDANRIRDDIIGSGTEFE